MTRKNDPPHDPKRAAAIELTPLELTPLELTPLELTLHESRYLDGELSAAEVRSMENRLVADPARAARLGDWRTAMDIWRDDAARAPSFEADALVDRILTGQPTLADARRAAYGSMGPGNARWSVSPTVGRWYATAAALLIALGVGGTLLAQPVSGGPFERAGARPQVAEFEHLLLDKMAEGPEFAPDLVLARLEVSSPTGAPPGAVPPDSSTQVPSTQGPSSSGPSTLGPSSSGKEGR